VITDNNIIYKNNLSNPKTKGVDNMQKTTTAVKEPPPESGVFMKRIGSTNYRVNVHFSKTSRETANDKIIRMIKNETTGKAAGE